MKIKQQSDYTGAGAAPLSMVRSYSSDPRAGWTHNWAKRLDLGGLPYVVWARGGSSDRVAFQDTGLSGLAFVASRPARDQLNAQTDGSGQVVGWALRVFEDDSIERYDTTGKLLSVQARNGWLFQLRYTSDQLERVVNHFGRILRFRYDSVGRLSRLIDPGQGEIVYRYDALNRLSRVTWQSGAFRRYHYED